MSDSKISIAVIITCYNRKGKTLKALTNLFDQKGVNDVQLTVYLVDDGSTDGTSDAVNTEFPYVKILKGDGTLFWNGGMRLAFSKAMKKKYDYYLWLNDDTYIYNDTLKKLIYTSKEIFVQKEKEVIVTGTIIDPVSGKDNYGGRRRKGKLYPINFLLVNRSDIPMKCDTFNGNIVLIPQAAVDKIGNISKEFSKQHNGDIDYGLRAKYAGFETWVTPGIIGECSSNPMEGTIYDRSLSFRERIKQMSSPKGVPPAKEWMIFTKRHGGFLWPYFWFRTIIRVILPFIYLLLRRPKQ